MVAGVLLPCVPHARLLDRNALSGELPTTLGHMTNLQWLYVPAMQRPASYCLRESDTPRACL